MANSPSYNPNNLSGTPKEAIVTVPSPTCLNRAQRLNRWWYDRVATWRGAGKLGTQYHSLRINGHEIKDVARYSELTLTGYYRSRVTSVFPSWR